MANPNDGTILGTAEVISDEYIDPMTGCRRDINLPGTAYKAPRSKIAVGPYGQDWGDATPDQPLPVESKVERRFLEEATLRDREILLAQYMKSNSETRSTSDARGQHLTTRGVR